RLLRHILGLEIREQALGQGLHVTTADAGCVVGIAAGKTYRSRKCSRRQKRARQTQTVQRQSPTPEASPSLIPNSLIPKSLVPNHLYPQDVAIARPGWIIE
ncbi:MAG: hypothetical protein QOD29_3824, partial [Alphaproteobacteria bacterium]|nr:hypothetical protein [Alphaproteobacteria bacterium]